MNNEAQNFVINLTAVIVAVTNEQPRVLVVDRPGEAVPALPSGPFDPLVHESLQAGLRQWVEAQTGLDLYYVEQLYTFGNRFRDPDEIRGGPRVVSVAYVALTHEDDVQQADAIWRNWYDFLPWEDWRDGSPAMIDSDIRPSLTSWMNQANGDAELNDRRDRINVTFGTESVGELDSVLTLERFELLYESGVAAEAIRDRAAADGKEVSTSDDAPGATLKSDHRRILASALGRLRGKLAYRPVVFELLPGEFTLLQLQHVAEALSGATLHKQNFRRLVANADLVEPVGRTHALGRGRPAELFRFRREVLGEKLTVGLARPIMRDADH